MDITPRALLRDKGTPYAALDLANPKWSDGELIDFMMAHPILINRPIVVSPKRCEIVPGHPRRFSTFSRSPTSVDLVKEDGEVVLPNTPGTRAG